MPHSNHLHITPAFLWVSWKGSSSWWYFCHAEEKEKEMVLFSEVSTSLCLEDLAFVRNQLRFPLIGVFLWWESRLSRRDNERQPGHWLELLRSSIGRLANEEEQCSQTGPGKTSLARAAKADCAQEKAGVWFCGRKEEFPIKPSVGAWCWSGEGILTLKGLGSNPTSTTYLVGAEPSQAQSPNLQSD